MQPSPHLPVQFLQLADHPVLLDHLAEDKVSVSGLAAEMREVQEVKRRRPCPYTDGIFQQTVRAR